MHSITEAMDCKCAVVSSTSFVTVQSSATSLYPLTIVCPVGIESSGALAHICF